MAYIFTMLKKPLSFLSGVASSILFFVVISGLGLAIMIAGIMNNIFPAKESE